MAGLLILPGKARDSQPHYNAPIDHEGLGKGMQLLFNPAIGPIDLVTGKAWSVQGDLTIKSGTRGKTFNFPGVDGGLQYTGYSHITGARGTFFAWCPVVGPKDDWGHVLLHASGSAYFLAHQFSRFYSFGIESTTNISGWFGTNNVSLVCPSADGTAAGMKVYQNGEDSGLAFATAPTAFASGDKLMSFGKHATGTVHDFNGNIRISGYTTAIWGKAEAKAFHDNPWQMFKSRKRHLFPVLAASTTHDLTLALLTLARVVSTPAITQVHLLSAAAQTLAKTYSSPTLTQVHALSISGLTLAREQGTVAVTVGASVTLTVSAMSAGTSLSTPAITQVHELQASAATLQWATGDVFIVINDDTLVVASQTIQYVFDSVAITVELNSTWVQEGSSTSSWSKDAAITNTWSV